VILNSQISLLNFGRTAGYIIEAASAAQASAKDSSVGKNAAIIARVDTMMQLINTCDYIIQNIAANDIDTLNSWHSATHVKQPPKKKTPTP
jgi:hypothetical protein